MTNKDAYNVREQQRGVIKTEVTMRLYVYV